MTTIITEIYYKPKKVEQISVLFLSRMSINFNGNVSRSNDGPTGAVESPAVAMAVVRSGRRAELVLLQHLQEGVAFEATRLVYHRSQHPRLALGAALHARQTRQQGPVV